MIVKFWPIVQHANGLESLDVMARAADAVEEPAQRRLPEVVRASPRLSDLPKTRIPVFHKGS
jgi:hypothetical protein